MVSEFVTRWFTPAILIVGLLHLLFFGVLWIWARRDLRGLAETLDRFTAGLAHRSRLPSSAHLSDHVDAFISDVHEALGDPGDREKVRTRIRILDERRTYLDSFRFETAWTVARSGIEAYPLLGVLGTIFALWLAMRGPAGDGEAAVGLIVSRFGVAIDSTFAGLAMAIALMVVNSALETLFRRVLENRRNVRDLIVRTKRELISPVPTRPVQSDPPSVPRGVSQPDDDETPMRPPQPSRTDSGQAGV